MSIVSVRVVLAPLQIPSVLPCSVSLRCDRVNRDSQNGMEKRNGCSDLACTTLRALGGSWASVMYRRVTCGHEVRCGRAAFQVHSTAASEGSPRHQSSRLTCRDSLGQCLGALPVQQQEYDVCSIQPKYRASLDLGAAPYYAS
ncbi:hypothetical protein B0T14DRAFT_501842 [Immersiella caudata]|uniref:Uncharacterized protein n=1 Tax=Immersiella caudata TaxID=314043 RepID=A0AA39XDQ8_9PEZI|nr:hypothetical protein B0T14DRAFT_501842 [Immersiella caudata]